MQPLFTIAGGEFILSQAQITSESSRSMIFTSALQQQCTQHWHASCGHQYLYSQQRAAPKHCPPGCPPLPPPVTRDLYQHNHTFWARFTNALSGAESTHSLGVTRADILIFSVDNKTLNASTGIVYSSYSTAFNVNWLWVRWGFNTH